MSPKRKSDASESRAMARFGVVERPSATPPTPEEIYTLREIASRLEAQVKSTTQAINRLHNLLARVFPELATITANVATGWVLNLLDKYPSPERIARAALGSLIKIPHVRQDKAKKLQEAAKKSVASLRGGLAEQLLRQAVTEVKHAQQGQQTLEKLLREAFAALPAGGRSQVATIAGIGEVTAAVLVAKIVSIDRFATAENLVGYFGVFPEEYSSGVDRNGNPKRRGTCLRSCPAVVDTQSAPPRTNTRTKKSAHKNRAKNTDATPSRRTKADWAAFGTALVFAYSSKPRHHA